MRGPAEWKKNSRLMTAEAGANGILRRLEYYGWIEVKQTKATYSV